MKTKTVEIQPVPDVLDEGAARRVQLTTLRARLRSIVSSCDMAQDVLILSDPINWDMIETSCDEILIDVNAILDIAHACGGVGGKNNTSSKSSTTSRKRSGR